MAIMHICYWLPCVCSALGLPMDRAQCNTLHIHTVWTLHIAQWHCMHRTAMYGLRCSWLVTKCIAQGHCMACTALFVTALALITQNTGLAVHSVQSPGFICRLATAIKAPLAFLAFQCTVKKATMNHFQMYPQIRLCQICLYEYIWAFVRECTVRESPVYIAHVYTGQCALHTCTLDSVHMHMCTLDSAHCTRVQYILPFISPPLHDQGVRPALRY